MWTKIFWYCFFWSVYAFYGCFLLTGCQDKKSIVEPAVPAVSTSQSEQTQTNSTVVISAHVLHSDIESIIESKTPTRFVSNGHVPQELSRAILNDYYYYDLSRGPISLKYQGNVVTFEVPIRGIIGAGGDFAVLGKQAGTGRSKFSRFLHKMVNFVKKITMVHIDRPIDVIGKIAGTVPVTITSNYSIATSPTLNFNFEKADICLIPGAPDLHVRHVLQSALDREGPKNARASIDAALAKADIRGQIEKEWQKLFMASAVKDYPNLWFVLRPVSMSTGSLKFESNPITWDFGATGVTKFVYDTKQPEVKAVPLPPLITNQALSNGCDLQIPLEISLDSLSQEFKRSLSGKQLNLSDVKFNCRDATLYANGDKIVIELLFDATDKGERLSADGKIFFVGKFVYDAAGKTLSIMDFDYDLQTQNYLAKSASWLLHSSLKDAINQAAHFNIRDEEDCLKSEGQRVAVSKLGTMQSFVFAPVVSSVNLVGLETKQGKEYALVDIKGSVDVGVSPSLTK